jgi:hypothetical protein
MLATICCVVEVIPARSSAIQEKGEAMHRRPFPFLLMATFAAVSVCYGAGPTTATTKPKVLPAPSWSTPLDTAVTVQAAHIREDFETVIKSIIWEKPGDADRYRTVFYVNSAANKLRIYMLVGQKYPDADTAARVKATREGVEKWKALAYDSALQLTAILSADADVKIDGDAATLTPKGSKRPMIFKKIDGKWLVTAETSGLPYFTTSPVERWRASDARAVRSLEQLHESQTAFEKDVAAHKFTSGKEALAAFEQLSTDRWNKLQKEEAEALTRPATGARP